MIRSFIWIVVAVAVFVGLPYVAFAEERNSTCVAAAYGTSVPIGTAAGALAGAKIGGGVGIALGPAGAVAGGTVGTIVGAGIGFISGAFIGAGVDEFACIEESKVDG